MGLLLDLGYATAGLVLSPWLLFKAATDRRYRHRLGERFGGVPRREGDGPCVWLHCASVGEVNVAKPLVKELLKRRPGLALRVSTMTMAGRENAEKAFPGAAVHYFPIDFTFAARRALRRARPDAVVLVELEVWPNFVRAAERRGTPVVVVNGRMSHRSHRRYRRFAFYFRGVFRRLAKVAAQTQQTADRVAELGVAASRLVVTGNLKFDQELAFDPAAARAELRASWGIGAEEPLLVGGSTHEPEERILVETWRELRAMHPSLRLLVAPRHLERVPEVMKVLQEAGVGAARRSLGERAAENSVMLLDTVGELAKTYAMADVVYIGGTFCARGGQNPLEPAAVAKPIVGGPSVENFREIVDELAAAGGMRVLAEPRELAHAVLDLLRDPEAARAMGEKAKAVLEKGRGAVARTVEVIEECLRGR